jgi:hypothetical protein
MIFSLHCQESNSTNPTSSSDVNSENSSQETSQSLNLTNKILENNKWNSDPNFIFGETISFQKGKVELELPGYEEPNQYYSGSYTIQDNQLVVSLEKRKFMDEVNNDSSKMSCIFSIAKESLYYNEKLDCVKDFDPDIPVSYYNLSSKLKSGERRMIDTTQVTILHKTFVSTVDALMVRNSPSAKAEPVQWLEDAKYDSPRTSLKKSEKVKVIARTIDKMDVGKMNNYWYYVEIEAVDEDHPVFIIKNGWVFGEFIK